MKGRKRGNVKNGKDRPVGERKEKKTRTGKLGRSKGTVDRGTKA